MVRAKAVAAKRPPKKPAVEELYFRSDSAYLCLLLNRRTRCIRVIDFRAGALPAKRLYIQSVATQEKVEKVITLDATPTAFGRMNLQEVEDHCRLYSAYAWLGYRVPEYFPGVEAARATLIAGIFIPSSL